MSNEMNTVSEQITPCIRHNGNFISSQKVFTIEGDAIGAAWDAVKKLQQLANWAALKPDEALKTLEDTLKDLETP